MGERGWESPEWERVCCPECGEVLGAADTVFMAQDKGELAGCRYCLKEHNAWEWLGEVREEAEDDEACWDE